MKKLFLILAALAVLALIAACAPAATPAPTAAPPTAAAKATTAPSGPTVKGNITIWDGYHTGDNEEKTINQLVDAAKKDFPDAKITVLEIPFEQLFNKFETEAATGGGPDMYIAPNDSLGKEARAGLLAPLDDALGKVFLKPPVSSMADVEELIRAMGAGHVIDYTQEDFTKSGRRYDLIVDAAARSLPDLRRALTPTGILVLVGGSPGRWVDGMARVYQARLLSPLVSQKLPSFLTRWSSQDLTLIRDLIEAGKITPVIDSTYPLSEAAAAMRHLEQGHARGKIVITV